MEQNEEKENSRKEEILAELERREESKIKEKEEEKISLVIFRIAKECYGIKIHDVKEIIKVSKIIPLPQVPEYILGIANLRGEILPLVDLRRLFNINISPFDKETRIIVVESDNVKIGLLVDSVTEVLEISLSQIDSPLSTLDRIKAEYIYGEIKSGDDFIAVIHLENIVKDVVTKK